MTHEYSPRSFIFVEKEERPKPTLASTTQTMHTGFRPSQAAAGSITYTMTTQAHYMPENDIRRAALARTTQDMHNILIAHRHRHTHGRR